MQSISEKNNVSKSLKNALNGKWLIMGLFMVLLGSTIRCANIQQPTGGPRDTIPPQLLTENPENLTTNFKERKIILEFDEFLKLNNPSREISISPEMERFPEVVVRRRNVEVNLPDSLEENTTYVINFGKAIADNNEGNAFENYSYVFSTGDAIDSLSIAGRVFDAKTNEPVLQASVILIPVSQDSTFGKKKANIFATTDSSGNFKLNYLREDQYRIYALQEQNNDRIYNSPDEGLAFLNDSINLQSDTSGILLWLSVQKPEELRVLDRQIEPNGRIFIRFNRPIDNPTISIVHPEPLDETKQLIFNRERDTAFLWVSELTFDSIKFQIMEDEVVRDSLLIRRPAGDRYNRTITITNNLSRTMVNNVKHLQLYSNTPIKTVDRGKIILYEDSVKVDNYRLERDSLHPMQYGIRYNWRSNKSYILRLEEGAFQGYFDEQNALTNFPFTRDDGDRYGHLTLTFKLPTDSAEQYVLEFIDEANTIVHQSDITSMDTTITYKNYLEGKYRIRVVYDANQNNQWDPGDLKTKTQAERIWYYNKVFNIRPNWEQEETITIPGLDSPRQQLPRSETTKNR